MLHKFASRMLVVGTLLTAMMPVAGLARDRGGDFRGGRSFSGGSRYSGPQRSVSPRGYVRGPSNYGRGYVAPRSYSRGSVYLGFGAPYRYGYGYAPGYVYDPGYGYYDSPYSYGPAPAPPVCSPGAYDRYGNWVPNPNCISDQGQYQTQQPNYDSRQQQPNYDSRQQQPNYDSRQAPPEQQPYDPNLERESQPEENYNPNQPPQRNNR